MSCVFLCSSSSSRNRGWWCDRKKNNKKKNRRPFPHYSFVVASAPLCSPWVWLPLPFAPSGLFSILENRPDFLREKTTLPGKKNREDGGRRRGTVPGPRRRKKQHKNKIVSHRKLFTCFVFFTLTLCLVFPEKKCTFLFMTKDLSVDSNKTKCFIFGVLADNRLDNMLSFTFSFQNCREGRNTGRGPFKRKPVVLYLKVNALFKWNSFLLVKIRNYCVDLKM